MELLFALAVIVAISELREWRFSKKVSSLEFKLEMLGGQIENLADQINSLTHELIASKEATQNINDNIGFIKEEISFIKQTAQASEANSATILKEYELNGIPLGYQRKQADFIEGL